MTTRFPAKQVAETPVLTFDFSKEATSISSPVMEVFVVWAGSGTPDPNPTAILSGAMQISGTKVLQRVQAGQDLTDYGFRCKAFAQDGETVVVVPAILPVRNQPKPY